MPVPTKVEFWVFNLLGAGNQVILQVISRVYYANSLTGKTCWLNTFTQSLPNNITSFETSNFFQLQNTWKFKLQKTFSASFVIKEMQIEGRAIMSRSLKRWATFRDILCKVRRLPPYVEQLDEQYKAVLTLRSRNKWTS